MAEFGPKQQSAKLSNRGFESHSGVIIMFLFFLGVILGISIGLVIGGVTYRRIYRRVTPLLINQAASDAYAAGWHEGENNAFKNAFIEEGIGELEDWVNDDSEYT
tara:strand:- start:1001 stop:1315 length:315 start_codon:yes stop_codon:yes gene_type:complete